ncbi:MAG: hypothetical protein ACTJLM_05570 [Ehrlichia sp.]
MYKLVCRIFVRLSVIACCLSVMSCAYANDTSAGGTLNLQYVISDQDLAGIALSTSSQFLFSHHLNDYVTIGTSLGTSLRLSASAMNNDIVNSQIAPDIQKADLFYEVS